MSLAAFRSPTHRRRRPRFLFLCLVFIIVIAFYCGCLFRVFCGESCQKRIHQPSFLLSLGSSRTPVAVADGLRQSISEEGVELCERIALGPDEPQRAEDASRFETLQRGIADAQVAASLPATEKGDGDGCLTFVGRYDSGSFGDAFFLHAERDYRSVSATPRPRVLALPFYLGKAVMR